MNSPTPTTDPAAGEWFDRVRRLYDEVEEEIRPHQSLCILRGKCCDFRRCDHRLYASTIEVAFAAESLRRRGEALPEADPDLCPFWRSGRCEARDERPLGCRTYFCDPSWVGRGEEIYERFFRRLRQLERDAGFEPRYSLWVEAIRDPRVAEPRGATAAAPSEPR